MKIDIIEKIGKLINTKAQPFEESEELYNERAAILEFDANMSRADAERKAKAMLMGRKGKTHE